MFRNGEGMHKIGRDGRIGLGTRGRTASALCKSRKTVDVYFAKTQLSTSDTSTALLVNFQSFLPVIPSSRSFVIQSLPYLMLS